jgi:hypothetical protein
MSNKRLVNLLPNPSGAVTQAGPFRSTFAVGSNDRKTGVYVGGLTAGQTVPVKLLVSGKLDEFTPADYQATDLLQIRTDGIDVVFTPDDNFKSFEAPGIYVLDVPTGATVSIGAYK